MTKSTQKLLSTRSSGWDHAKYLGNGYLASSSVEPDGLAFLHIPPVASQKPVESWSVPPLSFDIFDYAAYPPENVLAVAERREE